MSDIILSLVVNNIFNPIMRVCLQKTSETYELCRVPRSREVKQSWISTIFTTVYASLISFPLVFRIRPDLVSH